MRRRDPKVQEPINGDHAKPMQPTIHKKNPRSRGCPLELNFEGTDEHIRKYTRIDFKFVTSSFRLVIFSTSGKSSQLEQMDNFSTRRNYIYQNQKIINFRKNHKFLRKFLKVIILVGFEMMSHHVTLKSDI